MNKLKAVILPILGGLVFFNVLMGASLGIIALNASVSPAIPWFPVPAIGLVLLVTWWVNSRWPLRLAQPVGGRAYAVTLLLTYAIISLGVLESWVNDATMPAPKFEGEALSDGFQLTFLLVLPFIAAVLAEAGYRGLMQTALEKVMPLWPMLLLLAVLNFLMHAYDPEIGGQLLRLLGLNFAWGYMTWRTQSLRPALAGHILMNIAVPLAQYGSEQYGPGAVPFGDFPASTLILSGVCGAVALAAALGLMKKLPGRR